jgi:hypothetical protein
MMTMMITKGIQEQLHHPEAFHNAHPVMIHSQVASLKWYGT